MEYCCKYFAYSDALWTEKAVQYNRKSHKKITRRTIEANRRVLCYCCNTSNLMFSLLINPDEGCSINKFKNGVVLLIFKVWKIRNIRFVEI